MPLALSRTGVVFKKCYINNAGDFDRLARNVYKVLLGADVDKCQRLLARQQRRPAGQLGQQQPVHLAQLQHVPQVNERRNDPSVDGARIPPNNAGIAPCRSRSRSSMLSAPPVIPATIAGTLTWAFTPHGRAIRTYSPASAAWPARSARAMTGTRPARDTRFGSSNLACIFARSCNNRICEVSSPLGNVVASATPIVPVQRAPFASARPNEPLFTRWIEAK